MAIVNSKIEGRITVPTGGWSVAVTETGGGGGPHTVTVPAGDYYLSTGDTIADDLPQEFADQLTANASLSGTYTVTISAAESGTGLVTIAATGITSFTLTWTSTDLRDVLGFAGTLTPSAASFVGTKHARSLWLPNCPYSTLNHDEAGWVESDFRAQETMSGNAFLFAGERRTVNSIMWPAITRAKVWTANETTTNESLQTFWLDVILGEATWSKTAGGPIRWHARSASNDSTYHTYHATTWSEFKPDVVREGWTSLWRIVIPRLVVKP